MLGHSDEPKIRDFHVLHTIEELRALADQARVEMLRLLTQEPMTGSTIARAIGIPANRAHYHIKRLVSAGLARSIGSSRRGEWKGERYFIASARHFLVDPQLGCQDANTSTILTQSIESAFLDWRRTELLAIDWAPLAAKLTRETLRIAPDDHVLVTFRSTVIELVEAIVVEIEACGAVAHPRPWSRNVMTRTLDRYTADELEQLRFVPESIDRQLDAVVLVTSSLLHGPPPTPAQQEKLPKLLGSVSRWHQSIRERRLRYVEVALPHRAEFEHGAISIEASIDTFWRCIGADPHVLHERGERLRERVRRNPEIHVWGANGTDFRLTVVAEHTHVNDGIISEEDVRRDRCSEYLPTGGVSLLPVADSGDGVLCANYTLSQGQYCRDVRIELRDGRIVQIEAAEGAEGLRAQIERAAGQPEMISGLGIGINVMGSDPTGKPTLDAHLQGVITATFGNNELAGGSVKSTLTLNVPMWRLSADAGAEPLVRDGRLTPAGKGRSHRAR